MDLAGRRILSLNVSDRGPGDHVVIVGETEPLSPGVYFLRLVQGRQARGAKVVVGS